MQVHTCMGAHREIDVIGKKEFRGDLNMFQLVLLQNVKYFKYLVVSGVV